MKQKQLIQNKQISLSWRQQICGTLCKTRELEKCGREIYKVFPNRKSCHVEEIPSAESSSRLGESELIGLLLWSMEGGVKGVVKEIKLYSDIGGWGKDCFQLNQNCVTAVMPFISSPLHTLIFWRLRAFLFFSSSSCICFDKMQSVTCLIACINEHIKSGEPLYSKAALIYFPVIAWMALTGVWGHCSTTTAEPVTSRWWIYPSLQLLMRVSKKAAERFYPRWQNSPNYIFPWIHGCFKSWLSPSSFTACSS